MDQDGPSLKRRHLVEPDPAFDWSDDHDGVLLVELSWFLTHLPAGWTS